MNQKPRMLRTFRLSIAVVIALFVPSPAYSHEGDLDAHGCHHDRNRGDYHCHEGEFTGLSFDSKTQMVRLLRLQNMNRGRPLPDELIEEDITSAAVEAQEPAATTVEEVKNQTKSGDATVDRVPGRSPEEPTEQQMRPAKPTAKEEISVPKEKTEAPSKRSKSKQQQSVRVVNIRPDGFVVYEDLRGERFYLDDKGNKVYVRRKR